MCLCMWGEQVKMWLNGAGEGWNREEMGEAGGSGLEGVLVLWKGCMLNPNLFPRSNPIAWTTLNVCQKYQWPKSKLTNSSYWGLLQGDL